MTTPGASPRTTPAPIPSDGPAEGRTSALGRLSIGKLGGTYLLVLTILYFSIVGPDTFLQAQTFTSILNEQAVFALVAFAMLIPLTTGQLDVSVTSVLTLSAVTSSVLMVNHGWNPWLASIAALAACLVVGAVNGFLVVVLHVQSVVATIAMQSVLLGLAVLITDNREIIGLPDSFKNLGRLAWGDITIPVLYMVIVTVTIWYVLERTPVGRRMLATGSGQQAARLTGVPIRGLTFGSFVASSLIAGFAGLVLTAKVGSADPTIGEFYLLPAFAAVFLGATQFKTRANAFGTILAVYLLAVFVKGLQLSGADTWVPSVFNGLALAIAVAFAQYQRRRSGEQTSMAAH